MAWQLMREVLDHAPPELAANERLLLVAIAEYARVDGRSWTGPQAELARRCGVSAHGIRRVLGKLAAQGLEIRVPLSTDRHGQPIYAMPGKSPTFRLPALAPPGCTCDSCGPEGGTDGTPLARITQLGVPDGTPMVCEDAHQGVPGRTPRRARTHTKACQDAHPLRNRERARDADARARGARDAPAPPREAVRACPMCDADGRLLEVGRFVPVAPGASCDHHTPHRLQVTRAKGRDTG